MEIYLKTIKEHYLDFNGRARRKDFWMFILFNAIISYVLGFIDGLIGAGGFIAWIYGLAVLLPIVGLWVRRLQDTGKSPWWLLISLTGIGVFVLFIFALIEGDKGPNQYGEDPKAHERR